MEADKIVGIIESVSKSTLTEVEIESGDMKLKLSKTAGTAAVVALPQPVCHIPAPAVADVQDLPANVSAGSKPSNVEAAVNHNLKDIISPIVGTFYGSPKPESPQFVSVGSKVKKGDPLCIIEAMKLMNEIDAEFDCEIVEICAKNEQLVEFGNILFKVKPL